MGETLVTQGDERLSLFARELISTKDGNKKIFVGGQELTFSGVRLYLEATGDRNPIHYKTSAAADFLKRQLPEGTVIVPGCMVLGIMLGILDAAARSDGSQRPAAVFRMDISLEGGELRNPTLVCIDIPRTVRVYAKCISVRHVTEKSIVKIGFEVVLEEPLSPIPVTVATGTVLVTFFHAL